MLFRLQRCLLLAVIVLLFAATAVPAAVSGVDFQMSWGDLDLYLKEMLRMNPSGGICTGDINGDGFDDLLISAFGTNSSDPNDFNAKNNGGLYVVFEAPQSAITEGQFVSWHLEDELVGSGVIS